MARQSWFEINRPLMTNRNKSTKLRNGNWGGGGKKRKKKDADKLAVKKVSTQDNVILRKTNLFPSMICTVY